MQAVQAVPRLGKAEPLARAALAMEAVPRLGKVEPLARAASAEMVAPPRAAGAVERAVCPDRRPGAPLELSRAVPRGRTAALLGLPP